MMKNNFLRITTSTLMLLTSLYGCKLESDRSDAIIGEWDAHWETKADESFSEMDNEDLHMNGTIKFNPNGKVEIAAFGYEGCIFSDDTLKNILNWKIDDSVLRFIDKGDDQGLPYRIMKFTDNELQLTLLEDINLTLSRGSFDN